MSSRTMKRSRTPSVGSRVTLVFGLAEVKATVIEDRGNVGMGGRHLLRVRLDIPDAGDPIELEVPAEDLKIAA